MVVKVLAFGIAKEIMDGTSVDVELPGNTKVHELRLVLEEQYPALKQLSSYMVALNNEYANGEESINEQDEIAIIPPVSGG
jgi:molybdopterin converting factor subunit 1